VYELFARGPRISIFAACALVMGALAIGALATSPSAAIAQPAPAVASLDSVSSEASRYSILADALWAMGLDDVPEPLDVAQAAVAANPDSAEAHLRFGLAIRLATPQAVSLAKYQYGEALRLDPKLLRAYALLGEVLSDEGDAAGVEQNYRTWLALAPKDPRAQLSYAVALGSLGRLPEAGEALERSLALGPTAPAYVLRALKARGDPRDAVLADLDKAVAVGGGEARVYRWRARIRWEWGENDLALAEVAKALDHAPGSFGLRQLRGEINSDAGRPDLAIAEFDALIALQPAWPDLVNARCWARAKAGVELQKALVDCDTVLGWEPTRPEALDSRGLVKLRLGDLGGAIADYDAALTEDPELATALFGRGLARRRSGAAGGDADLDRARAVEPGIDKRFADFGLAP